MRRLITAALLWTCLFASSVAPAAAHLGGEAFILVPLDHILPGQTFEVIAADVSPDALISFRIQQDTTVTPLQSAQAGPDGHFQTNLTLPSDFPTGYAELVATATDGTSVSTWVLVGQRSASTPPPPNAQPWWTDPSILVLIAFVVGSAAILGYLVLWPRRQPPAPAGIQRRSVSTKRSRKRR